MLQNLNHSSTNLHLTCQRKWLTSVIPAHCFEAWQVFYVKNSDAMIVVEDCQMQYQQIRWIRLPLVQIAVDMHSNLQEANCLVEFCHCSSIKKKNTKYFCVSQTWNLSLLNSVKVLVQDLTINSGKNALILHTYYTLISIRASIFCGVLVYSAAGGVRVSPFTSPRHWWYVFTLFTVFCQ